ncbi:hypothetical protein EJD97_022579 [Solanum chilense]|uniref:Uncharacterized protein n=1 Tax=Solanum chilense TaxID=4083 RepID=A0A6N2C348_SOLCI|nr:hypothetical protein EJD97_022579 [Solanum chilense]
MAAAPFLLESNLKWNPLFYTPNPIQCTRLIHYQKLTPSKFSKTSKLTVKCFSKNHKNVCFNDGNELEMKNKENPFEIVVKSVMKALKALQKPAVAAVLVGLLLMAVCLLLLEKLVCSSYRSLQKDLNRIAEVADTSTPEGLSFVLTETTLALLRHPGYCISAYSSVDVKRSMEEGENRFNQLSIEERGKFDEETLVNVNNIRRKSSTSQRATGFSNEYIVVTILVAAEGAYKLPTINGSGDLKEALQKIASIPSSRTLAVEILWTPQNENDTLSERQLLEDYPLLRPL